MLKDIANEERVHVEEFLRLLRELAPDEEKFYADGSEEVEKVIKKIVKPELEKAFLQEGPILVTIQTDPNALAMPPKLELAQMKGMALYMGKMMLSGRMDEVFKIISSNYKHLDEIL